MTNEVTTTVQSQTERAHTETGEETTAQPSLLRHPVHRLIGGVCGGIADTLRIDPTLVRIFWIVITIGTAGAGLLAYLALWLLLPTGTTSTGVQSPAAFQLNEHNVQRAGFALVALGTLWLLANLGMLSWVWGLFWSVVSVVFWPALLIGAGLLLLKNQSEWRVTLRNLRERLRKDVGDRAGSVPVSREGVVQGLKSLRQRIPLKRSRNRRLLLGVCGGMAQTFNIDSNLVRLFWILFSIGSVGTGVLVYLLVGIVLPEADLENDVDQHGQDAQDIQIIDGTVS